MKKVLCLFLCSLIVGCASLDYQPYEGKSNFYEGTGGTKVVADNIDFWANGTPPRKFKILGVVTSEILSGRGDESMIRSAVAGEVKRQGGDAAIEITNNNAFAGMLQVSPSMYTAGSVKRMQFTVVKYLQ